MLLRKILDKCVMLELLPANPASVAYRMPKQSNKLDTTVYSLSELCEVLEALRNSWRTIMRWELGIDSDYVEKMMGHAGKGVGEIHYDRPQWRQFADVAGEAWVRYMAKNN